MSVTLHQLMDMPVTQGATLLAGDSNMQNIINSVSVYDHYSAELLNDVRFQSPEYLLGELVITGYMYRHSVEEQCACIRRLSEAKASGLVIFFVGLFTERVEPTVIETARALSFPLILMPPNRYLYSDLITAVMKAVLSEQDEKQHLMNIVFERMAQLEDNRRTADNLLRILSNYVHASIALYDRDLNMLNSAPWPNARQNVFREEGFLNNLPVPNKKLSSQFTAADGTEIYYAFVRTPIRDIDARYLAILSEYGPIDEKLIQEMVDILRLYFNIWGKGSNTQSAGELVRAIIKNEVIKAQKLAKVLRVDLGRLETMWLVSLNGDVADEEGENYLRFISDYLKQSRLKGIFDLYSNCIIVFIETPSYQLDYKQVTETFQAGISGANANLYFLFQPRLRDMLHVNEVYGLFRQYLDHAKKIFPYQTIFTEQALFFAKQCSEIVQNDKEALNRYLLTLGPLLGDQQWQQELLITLGVYLLDADGINETADKLFVHISTVKYRLKRLSEILGYDVKKKPEAYHLYQAIALSRLMP
ncbi:PucR family transcriptional regulator ligand-binding domain-containing protein [Christensenellaceae bacterium OttesenSCG-928-M15]|nr:PucR family transcriptional regulator ligand-binding domain-containing protein [Christensenellaceae bacterium OttesenSCG-928-M15]